MAKLNGTRRRRPRREIEDSLRMAKAQGDKAWEQSLRDELEDGRNRLGAGLNERAAMALLLLRDRDRVKRIARQRENRRLHAAQGFASLSGEQVQDLIGSGFRVRGPGFRVVV